MTDPVFQKTVLKELKYIKNKLGEHDKRFDNHDKRFEIIDKRFESIDKRFDNHDKRFDQLENTVKEGQKTIINMISDLREDFESSDFITRAEMTQAFRHISELKAR